MNWKANGLVRGQKPRQIMPYGKRGGLLVHGHQSFPRTAQRKLNSKSGRQQQIDFPGLNFLKIAGGDLGFFGQFLLRQPPMSAFAPDVCPKRLNSFPFSFGNCHDILHRLFIRFVNDTYIVNKALEFLKENPTSNVLLKEGTL